MSSLLTVSRLLYTTNQYRMVDSLKYGMTMMVITWCMIILWGMTMLRYLGYTPEGVFFDLKNMIILLNKNS
jgi:hypothetical protein